MWQPEDIVEAAQFVRGFWRVVVGQSRRVHEPLLQSQAACLIVSGAYNRPRQGGARNGEEPDGAFPPRPRASPASTPRAGSRPTSRDLQHEGTIPPELDGAFYRVQPDPQFPPRLGDDIAFNGDGMISRFHFHDGQCDFRQRWAQTDKWKVERAGRQGAVRRLPQPADRRRSVKGMIRSTANTTAFPFAGKLWAMKEDCPSLVMDPVTMETDRVRDLRRQDDRADLHRAPQGRSHDRQHGRDRLRRERPVHRRRVLLRGRPRRRADPREVVQGAVLLHDARLRDHPRLPRAAHRPLDRLVGAARGDEAALRLRHLAAGLSRDHPAPRRHEARGHPLVQARQLLRQPRAQRLAGGHARSTSSPPRRRTTCSRSSPT